MLFNEAIRVVNVRQVICDIILTQDGIKLGVFDRENSELINLPESFSIRFDNTLTDEEKTRYDIVILNISKSRKTPRIVQGKQIASWIWYYEKDINR